MPDTIKDRINLLILPPGRRAFAQSRMLAVAKQHDDRELAESLEDNVVFDRKARLFQLQLNEHEQTVSAASSELGEVDNQLDRMVAGLHAQLSGLSNAFGETDPGPTATHMLGALFPVGLAAITNARYVDQHAAIVAMTQRIDDQRANDDSGWGAAMPGMGIEGTVERMTQMNARYGELLLFGNEQKPQAVSRQEFRDMEAEGHRRLLSVVAHVCRRYDGLGSNGESQDSIFAELMAPVVEQEELIRERRRTRRAAVDIDPDLGEPVEPTSESEVSESN